MAEFFAYLPYHAGFALIGGRQRDVAAFTADRDPLAIAGHQAGDPEPGAGPYDAFWFAVDGTPPADGHEFVDVQVRKGIRQRLEVV